MCLTYLQSQDGLSIIGASWLNSTIEIFPVALGASTPAARTLVPSGLGLTHPTSVRWGSGHPGFPSTSLFVSQGDTLFASQATDGVFRVNL